MRIHIIVTEIAVVALAHQVGHRPQGEQVVRRLHRQAVLETEALAGLHFFPDRIHETDLALHHLPVLSRPIRPLRRLDDSFPDTLSVILVRTEGIINRGSPVELTRQISDSDNFWPTNL